MHVTHTLHFDTVALLPNTDVIVKRVEDFDEVGLHTHEFIEIAYVRDGHGWHLLGEELVRCGPGCVYLIDCEDAHMFVADHDSTMTIYNLIFRPGFFDTALLGRQSFADVIHHFLLRSFREDRFAHSLQVRFDGDELPAVSRLFEDMLREYEAHDFGFEELIRAWTIELLVYIFRRLRAEQGLSAPSEPLEDDLFHQVFEHIRANYAEPISLERLSMLAFLSPKYFSRLFKAHTGVTLSEYVQNLRVERAKELLLGTELSVEEIASCIGYNDVKYFRRVFRRITGKTPTEFRGRYP